MSDELFETANWLINAIAKELAKRPGRIVNDVLQRLAEQDLTLDNFTAPPPTYQTVTRYFANTVAQTMITTPSLAASLATIDDHLNWLQTSSYRLESLSKDFFKNYAWCELIGPKGFFPGDDFLLGLLLVGPYQHYPDHFHPAPELYWPLTGPSLWKQGGNDFTEKQAGDVIFHKPMEHHATKSTATPLLAVWCWPRDTATAARLV